MADAACFIVSMATSTCAAWMEHRCATRVKTTGFRAEETSSTYFPRKEIWVALSKGKGDHAAADRLACYVLRASAGVGIARKFSLVVSIFGRVFALDVSLPDKRRDMERIRAH